MRGQNIFKGNVAAIVIATASLAIQYQAMRLQKASFEASLASERIAMVEQAAKLERQAQLLQAREDAVNKQNIQTALETSKLAKEKAEFAIMQANSYKPDLPEVKKSSIFDVFNDLFNFFTDYLSCLDFYHTSVLLNILILTAITLCLFNMFFLGYSNYFLSSYNIESRFPKFAKIILTRKSLAKGSLLLYTIALVCLILYGITINVIILLIL